jgi:hypothetical protein
MFYANKLLRLAPVILSLPFLTVNAKHSTLSSRLLAAMVAKPELAPEA